MPKRHWISKPALSKQVLFFYHKDGQSEEHKKCSSHAKVWANLRFLLEVLVPGSLQQAFSVIKSEISEW